MKKTIVLFVFANVFCFFMKGQVINEPVKQSESKQKCIKKGDILVDAYYGFPNFYSSILKSQIVSLSTSTVTAIRNYYSPVTFTGMNNLGPLGAKAEYLLADKFGINVEFNYSNTNIAFSRVADPSNPVTYHYSISSPAFRCLFGFNMHFVNTDVIDVYGAVKAGYYNRTFSFTTDEPGFRMIFNDPPPVAFRLEMGMRYFFTKSLGLHINIGLGGGPLIAGGLSVKL